MRTVDIKEKTRLLNVFISQSRTKTFTYEELAEELKNITARKPVLSNLIKLFPCEQIGRSKLYEMPSKPIYIGLVEKCWNYKYERRNNASSSTPSVSEEDAALALLASKGYQIRRVVGFDLERFQKENPDLYKKYLKYEII